jgi:tetratricopeptide (TPR) repeat protein
LATLPIVPLTVVEIGGISSDIQQGTGPTGPSIGDQLRADSSLSRLDYLFTQFRVIVTYLRLLILPVNQNLDYDYPVYSAFFTPPVFLSFLLLAALFALAVYLFRRTGYGRLNQVEGEADSGRKRPTQPQPALFSTCISCLRLIAFGILWFFLTLAVESSLIPIDDVIMEHRLYLPGFGAATAFATAFFLMAGRSARPAGGRLLVPVAVLLVLGLGLATWQRNQVWGNAVRLWQDVVAKSPNKGRAQNNLGVALTDAGRLSEAIEVLSGAMALKPSSLNVYNNLGKAYIMNDQSEAALPLLKKAIGLDRQCADSYINLAMAYNQLRQFLNTMALLEQNRHWIGDRVEAHYHLGVAYAFLGYREAASRKLEIVEGRDPVLAADLRRLLE